jgi:hypothetical protein
MATIAEITRIEREYRGMRQEGYRDMAIGYYSTDNKDTGIQGHCYYSTDNKDGERTGV